MPTDPAGLVSQLEGARGTKLDPVILVRVRRSLGRPPKLPSHCDVIFRFARDSLLEEAGFELVVPL